MARTSFRVRVTGDKTVVNQLKQVGIRMKNLSDSLGRTGTYASNLARSLVRSRSGGLAASIRPDTNERTRLTLVAGGPSRVPHSGGVYASTYYYGTHTHKSHGPRPFLRQAAERSEGVAKRNMDSELQSIIRRAGLS